MPRSTTVPDEGATESFLSKIRRQCERHPPRETKWIVLTGGPSSGKTALTVPLAAKGVRVIPEQALAVLNECLRTRTLVSIVAKPSFLVERILERNVGLQDKTPVNEPVLWDRTSPDVLAFALTDGVPYDPILADALRFRPAHAFTFPLQPARRDGTTYHSPAQRVFLNELCGRIYETLGTVVHAYDHSQDKGEGAVGALEEILKIVSMARPSPGRAHARVHLQSTTPNDPQPR
jgi:predicted ATPase